jgi:hypothetical protein
MDTFNSAVAQFDFSEARDKQAEHLRQQFLERFPASKPPSLKLGQYALGLDDPKDTTFCHWLEFKTSELGRIGGGFVTKPLSFSTRKRANGSLTNGTAIRTQRSKQYGEVSRS